MAGSPVDICNLALAHIKAGHIMALNERSRAAEDCKRFYDEAIRAALSSMDWSFARAYTTGVLLADIPPLTGWAYAFQYPTDCLVLRGMGRAYPGAPRGTYEVATNVSDGVDTMAIMCNVAAPTFVYTRSGVSVERFPSSFVLAASYQLAAMLAMPLAGKLSLVDAMRKMAVAAAAQARTENLNEEPTEMQDRAPPWLLGRGSGQYLGRTRDYDPGSPWPWG